MSTFTGADLFAFRKRWKLTRPQLAELIGVNRNSILKWEQENTELSLTVRLALAAWLNNIPPVTRAPAAVTGMVDRTERETLN
jgi:DNA-binding XRE family transcriptional regulator